MTCLPRALVQDWVKKMRLQYLPIPKYITSGSHEFKGVKYRFMVMQRFGTDIEKHFRIHTRFSDSTVCYLALRMVCASLYNPTSLNSTCVQLEALQFLHQSEYAHADIKGSNLLTGLGCEEDHVYLVDYGLAYRYRPEGKHKEYLADPRRAHDGTVEYTSIDAHDGVSEWNYCRLLCQHSIVGSLRSFTARGFGDPWILLAAMVLWRVAMGG